MEQLLILLNSFYPVSDAASLHLQSIAQPSIFKPRQYLLKAGRISDRIFFIEQGLVRFFYPKGEKEETSWFMSADDLAISPSFFTGRISRESIQAVTETHTYSISRAELQWMYDHYGEFDRIGRLISEKYHVVNEERIYILHLPKAEEKYSYLKKHHSDLILQVPAKYLASYLNITPQHLSLIRSAR
jgi:CRP-like cAMP-binding protein